MKPRATGLLFLATQLLAGCAMFGTKSVFVIETKPSGAEVMTAEGKSLGISPLRLGPEEMETYAIGDRIFLLLRASGHVDRELVLDVHGEDKHQVVLTPINERAFTDTFLRHYGRQSNFMARELLRIHGMLIARQYDQTRSALQEFQKQYPNLAATYVLFANVEFVTNNPEQARSYLLRARTLDPEDSTIARMLQTLERKKP